MDTIPIGFYSKLFSIFIPKKVKDKLTNAKKNALKKDIEKIDSDIKYYKKQMSDSQDRLFKAIEKETGVKMDKKTVDKHWEKLIS